MHTHTLIIKRRIIEREKNKEWERETECGRRVGRKKKEWKVGKERERKKRRNKKKFWIAVIQYSDENRNKVHKYDLFTF